MEQARSGDQADFAALVLRYQEMALAYALSLVHDYHTAQDVTQEALLAAYRGLPTLHDPTKFPAWLRGIVRFQCARLYRARVPYHVPLEHAWFLADALHDGLELHLEVAEGFHRIMAAIRELPHRDSEMALLFYVKDYSQREIADFLDVPVTTVNNRMHAARQALRKRLTMTTLKSGSVETVTGPVVDVRFAPGETPLILSALSCAPGSTPVLQVVQRSGDGLVRCIIRDAVGRVTQSAPVYNTGGPLLTVLDATVLNTALPLLVPPSDAGTPPVLLETGIKVLDLLCPFTRGGSVGIVGPSGAGRMVVSAEVLRNTARDSRGVTIVAFIHGEAEARGWYDPPDEVPYPIGSGVAIALPIENSVDPAAPAVLSATGALDARVYLSFTRTKSGLWPAVDPLLSTSRLLDPLLIGQEHYGVATAARALLRRARDLQEGGPDGHQRGTLTMEEHTTLARARKLQRYFTQPFGVAEEWTRRPGVLVPLAETLTDCRALLGGVYDGIPEEDFMWRGSLDTFAERLT